MQQKSHIQYDIVLYSGVSFCYCKFGAAVKCTVCVSVCTFVRIQQYEEFTLSSDLDDKILMKNVLNVIFKTTYCHISKWMCV